MSISPTNDPAFKLVGQEINGRWRITKLLSRETDGATGAAFSVPYECENLQTGKKAFLKLIHLVRAMETYSDKGIAEVINAVTESHLFEVRLANICREQNMSRVVHAIDHGETRVVYPQMGTFQFPLIIFDLADGDIHSLLIQEKRIDGYWKINTLHQVATAVQQLHKGNIAHQDIKRSNVVLFGEENAKLTDLGRAVMKDTPSRNNDRVIPCQLGNSPPELLYGHRIADWGQVHFSTDLYMLGNLAYTLFYDITITARLMTLLPEELRCGRYTGNYQDVLPALQHSLGIIISEIGDEVPEAIREDYKTVIRLLCNPDPATRGHPKDHAQLHGRKYSAERFISAFDAIKRKTRQLLVK